MDQSSEATSGTLLLYFIEAEFFQISKQDRASQNNIKERERGIFY